MNIWIIQTGEPLHCDKDNSRPMRAMNLANFLISKGHNVTIWSSNFYHQKKIHRYTANKEIIVNNKLKIKLINSPGYTKNVGIKRLYDHLILGNNMYKEMKKSMQKPDMGFIGFPPMEVGYYASKWFRENKIKYFVDIKDPWPDHLVEAFPKKAQWLIKIFFTPYYYITKKTFTHAHGISAITKAFLEWSEKIGENTKKDNNFVFPLAPSNGEINKNELISAEKWAKKIVKDGHINILFAGSIGPHFEFNPVFKSAEHFIKKNLKINFIICGDGPHKKRLSARSENYSNIIFPGWISKAQLQTIGKLCDFGIAPYVNNNTFTNTISNKIIDYLSMGLPILTSITGSGAKYLEKKYNIYLQTG